MSSRKVSRREFFRLGVAAAAGGVLASCAKPTPTPPPKPTTAPVAPTAVPVAPTKPPAAATTVPPTAVPPTAAPKVGGEAPMLAELVKQGKLPALKDRLPPNPKVVKPVDKIGVYGETMNRGTVSVSGYLAVTNAYEPLIGYAYPMRDKVEPNLAEKWEFNADGTQMTVYLRKGIKWSDGQPFTTADVMFLWEDVWFTKEALTPAPASLYVEKDTPAKLEKIDDYTLKFTFGKPFFYAAELFPFVTEWAWPKHYMQQFHPKYNKSATWEQFNQNKEYWQGRGKVTLQAWMLEDYQADKGLKCVRNPYYWKVDTEGNQLPYVDRLVWNIIQDRPTIALKCVAGEIDLDGMWVGIPQIPLFFEEKPKRGFDIGWYLGQSAWTMRANFDHPDEAIRKTLRNLDFRRALALAINRKEINKTYYYDLCDIANACFGNNTPFYEASTAAIYSGYDPAQAKSLLDKAGFKDVNNDGWRETVDGKPLNLIVDVYQHDLYVPLMEMVAEQMRAVGLKTTLNIQLQDAIFQRAAAFEFMFTVGDGGGFVEPLEQLGTFIPVSENTPDWHHLASKEPMSPEYARFIKILEGARSLPRDEMIKQMKEANKLMAEQCWFWRVGTMKRPYFIGKGVYNVPKEAVRSPADTPPLMPHQIFIKR